MRMIRRGTYRPVLVSPPFQSSKRRKPYRPSVAPVAKMAIRVSMIGAEAATLRVGVTAAATATTRQEAARLHKVEPPAARQYRQRKAYAPTALRGVRGDALRCVQYSI